MKKVLMVLLTFMIVVTFCACSEKPIAQPSEENSQPIDTPLEEDVVQMLKLLTNPNGMYNITYSNDGAYEWVTREDFGSNLTYIDFETHQKVYLCSESACKHNDETCRSWFNVASGYLFYSEYSQNLYCVKSAEPNGDPVESLIKVNKNGTEQKTICKLESGEMFCGSVVEDKETLYMTIMSPNGKKLLKKIDTKTGELTQISELTNTEWVFGVYKNSIIILSLSMSDTTQGTYTYDICNLQTGERENFYTYPYNDSGNPAYGKIARYEDNYLYVINPTGNNLSEIIKINMETDEETTLCSDAMFFHVDTTSVMGFHDSKMIITVTDNSNPESIKKHMYAANCESGEILPLDHTFLLGELLLTSEIFAESKTEFLISGDYKMNTIPLYDNSGVAYMAEVYMPTYRFIDKKDYWNSVHNYKEIIDLTLK